MHHKILSRSGSTESDSVITQMGTESSGWTEGLTHDFDNGTYTIYWGYYTRTAVVNKEDGYSDNGSGGNSNRWRNETMVRIGGDFVGNVSPVSAVPPVVQVQDNTSFTYQVNATDANGDNLTYRWGTFNEFFYDGGSNGDRSFTMPTGMTLSSSGLIEWDIRDNVTCDDSVSGCTNPTNDDAVDNTTNSLWVAVIMVEDRLDNGTAKSRIPIDFFFKVTDPTNAAAEFTVFPTGTQTIFSGSTKTITIKSTDDSGTAPTITVLNPPSDNSSIWSTSSSTSGGETTFSITFAPDSSMEDTSYVVNIRSTDGTSMTKDQSFGIQVSSVTNADPTAPILLSPADDANVTSPVTFRFAGSTDSDGDNVSYTRYVCTNSGFVGCSGTSVTAGGNFVPPFNQNFHDNLMWPSPLHAATSSQQISQDISMIPKLFIMLAVLGLLSVIMSLSVKNIKYRRIAYILFLIIIGTAVSCKKGGDPDSSLPSNNGSTTGTDDSGTTDGSSSSSDTTAPTVSSVSTTADNQSSVSITDNIAVTFSEAMDTTYVTTSTADTNCAGTIRVSSDNFSSCVKMSSEPVSSNSNKTFTLDPNDNLTRLTTYKTRVTTGVKDTAGNTMISQYETSSGFTTDNISTAKITVSDSNLTSGTTYYWKVVATDTRGASSESETWSFTVQ
ncbi:Ig-like domain-containing protein [Deltaproteobacteria bacterium]|nr:Ig-like domain-containing protein [Deltaproteobacteria bacterium]